jgi:type III restriction enzyme
MDSKWEGKLASVLEEMPEVRAYVKNQGLNFRIPYTFQGDAANYLPDFIVRYDDGGPEPLNLIIEVTGQFRREKAAKAATAIDLWVPAVNNHGRLGRWSFLEVTDPWDAANLIRAHLAADNGARLRQSSEVANR